MIRTIICPHCGFTTTTSKDIKPFARARCPKCREAFEIAEESEPQIQQAYAFAQGATSQDKQDDIDDVLRAVKAELDDGPQVNQASDVEYDAHRRALPRLPKLSEEPWFYGHLWTHGSLLKGSGDLVCALLLLLGGVGFLLSLSAPWQNGMMIVLSVVGAMIYLFVIGSIWFAMRIVAASVLLKVDSARNIRKTCFAIRCAHFRGPFVD